MNTTSSIKTITTKPDISHTPSCDGENKREKQLAYWLQTLSGYEMLLLPIDKQRPNQFDFHGRQYRFDLDKLLSQQLRELARTQGTSLDTVLLSGFYITLATLSGQEDILLGTPCNTNSPHPIQSIDENLLPLRAQVTPKMSISSLINQIHQVSSAARDHQDLSFINIIDELGVERDDSRHPLFQTLFGMNRFLDTDEQHEEITTRSRFDLNLFVDDSQEKIAANLNYATSLFDHNTVVRIAALYQRILCAFSIDSAQLISQLELLSDDEQQTLLYTWNQTDSLYPMDKTLHQCFEEQAARTPDKIAIVFEEKQLTYRELNECANKLARLIRHQYKHKHQASLKPDTLIALYLDRSLEMVISLLAVLKAGGAYVPVSPEYPSERTKYILQDTLAPVVITQRAYLEQLDNPIDNISTGSVKVAVDDIHEDYVLETSNLDIATNPTDLAYVIYTSGTTGQPKGVMIEHRGVINACQHMTKSLQLKEDVHVLFFSNYVFDASVFELYPALFSGCKVFIAPNTIREDIGPLTEFINGNNITHAFIPTVLVNQFSAELQTTTLITIHTGGDKLNILAELPAKTMLNSYGPTETTVYATQHIITNIDDISIGKPIDNTRLYVLSPDRQLVPIGTPGELYIGGAGVARGYLNQPALTAERYIENPFATKEDKAKGYTRLYRTGDLVRWRQTGILEFLGRTDLQVKIRGYRIELGEIENALNELPVIKQSVVIDRSQDGNKYLAAYVVKQKDSEVTPDELRLHLKTILPNYMLPFTYTVIDSIPLTINGKLNRRALPDPWTDVCDKDIVQPKTEIEAKLIDIWREVLNIKKLGVTCDFFEIGGHSINAIKAVKLAKSIGLYITVKDFFDCPTIQALAKRIVHSATDIISHKGTDDGPVLTLPNREMLNLRGESIDLWNSGFFLKIDPPPHTSLIEEAARALWRHHDGLRLRLAKDGNWWKQTIVPTNAPMTFEHFDLKRTPIEKQGALIESHAQALQDGMRMSENVFKVAVFDLGRSQPTRILLLAHHIILDDLSLEIILDDFTALLSSTLAGEPLPELEKTMAVIDWSNAVYNYANSNQAKKHGDYWLKMPHQVPSLPVDFEQGNNTFETERNFSKVLVDGLRQVQLGDLCFKHRIRIDSVFITALLRAFKRWCGLTETILNCSCNGRYPIDDNIDLSNTIGWLAFMAPIYFSIGDQDDISSQLDCVIDRLQTLPAGGLAYGALKYLCDNEDTREAFQKVNFGQLTFNYSDLRGKPTGITKELGQFNLSDAPESMGQLEADKSLRERLIDIVIIHSDDEITIRCHYSNAMHKKVTLEKLVSYYQEEMTLILEHLASLPRKS
ncbi:amino acid adenylation domain-containing protein [Photobacterium alginatilyticum]|uniref:non-ribosomal peptide synthetase n=1 Tax=Photobacterium alginatilyticum TaxID=1775171 RepID=UPI0040695976